MLRSPAFWYKPISWQSIVFYPFSLLVQFATRIKACITKPVKLSKRAICIGNIVTGGAGKTPTCIAIAKLCQQFKNPAFLTRGYGGTITKPTLVQGHDYTQVGDEALLLAEMLPTWVANNRVDGAKAADADLLILDDGLQNPGFVKDLSFLIIDGHQGIGNGLVIPAGPLRETLAAVLQRADAVIIINDDIHQIAKLINTPLFKAKTIPQNIDNLRGKPLIAFAGLGYPEKFFAMLRQYGVDVIKTISFPDHHPYKVEEINTLKSQKATLVTTRKDMIKIPKECRDGIEAVDIELVFEQPEAIYKFIRDKIN